MPEVNFGILVLSPKSITNDHVYIWYILSNFDELTKQEKIQKYVTGILQCVQVEKLVSHKSPLGLSPGTE